MDAIKRVYISKLNNIGLNIANVSNIRKQLASNLSYGLEKVKRNLLIDYGEFGYHLPDADFVIYEPRFSKIVAVVINGPNVRENILQAAYIKTKFLLDSVTKHIRVIFIVSDASVVGFNRAIIDTDGGYVFSGNTIERSGGIKTFDEFIKELKNITT